MSNLRIVSTSWDDGDICDLRIAELLRSRRLPGTFYVPIHPYKRKAALDHLTLRSMTFEGFEIGAHGIDHELLPTLSVTELNRVARTCKQVLGDILGKDVPMYCYPRGRYNSTAVRCLKEAGYQGGRTIRMLATKADFGPFDMPTTIQAYRHTRTEYLRNVLRAGSVERLYDYATDLGRDESWLEIGKRLFDRVLNQGGIWHLYGHSWEVDELGLWDELTEMLDYISGREGVLYIPNGEILRYLPSKN